MGMLHGDFEVVDELPARPGQAAAVSAEPANSDRRGASPARAVYTIAAGDTLRGVAAELYHDGRRWKDILAANPGLDPRRLRPGQVIELPEPIGAPEP